MIFRVNRPAITKKKIPKTVASKQNNREKTVCRKKDSAGSSVCVGQMTSCIGVALLCCRALLSVGGRRRRRSGSFPLSLSVLFFLPLASGGSSHGRTSFGLCLGRATSTSDRPLCVSLSAGTDMGSGSYVTPRGTNE